MGYTFQEKSAKHCDLVPILHLPWTQFPFGSTDLVGAWLSLVEGEPEGDGVRGWEAGPTGRSELARRTHHGRSELVAPLLRFLNLSGACRERSVRHLLARDIGGPSGPRPPETQAEDSRDPARSLPRAGGAAPHRTPPPQPGRDQTRCAVPQVAAMVQS